MVLIPLEGVPRERVELLFGSVHRAAIFGDLFQQEGVRAIEQRDVDVASGHETLKVGQQIGIDSEGIWNALEQHGEIDIASRMLAAVHRRSELQ